MADLRTWAEDEFGRAELGDDRRIRRLVTLATALATQRGGTVAAVGGTRAGRQGAYRFLCNRHVRWQDIAEASSRATARRCYGEEVVLVPVDGSSLAFADHDGDNGTGPIGTRTQGARGLKMMTAYVLRFDGVPLGVGAQVVWARGEAKHPVAHERRALGDKESRDWTELQRGLEATFALEGVRARPWYQMDREADQLSVLLRGLEPGGLVTVRCDHNRRLAARLVRDPTPPERKLLDELEHAPAWGQMMVRVEAGPKRRARAARLELSVVHTSVRLRQAWSKRHLADVVWTAVRVREAGTCPAGETPLEWILWTSYPVHSFADACQVVRGYTLRWRIESWHFALKSGGGHSEDAQLESFGALAKWATVQSAVAARAEHLVYRSRQEPELPAEQEYANDEVDTLRLLDRQHTKTSWFADPQHPRLGEATRAVAQLGGYMGSRNARPPGVTVVRRGLERLALQTEALALARAVLEKERCERSGQ